MPDSERIPVIVGVGQVNDRPADPEAGLNPVELMEASLRAADSDAGGGWLRDLDSLGVVPQISFPQIAAPQDELALRLGASPRDVFATPQASGDSPILLLNRAANMIGEGSVRIAAIAGGEAMRTAARRARGAAAGVDLVRSASSRKASSYRQRYGLTAPTDVYPLYENACRAAWGQSLAQSQAESAEIWAGFAATAARSEGAWLRNGATAAEIATVSPGNRLVSFPYTKLMVANSSVNQGAGFIVTSLAEARRRGVPEARLVHVGHGAAAREDADPLARDGYAATPSLEASIRGALAFNALTPDALDHVELYSCFPCVPKMARRVLGWPASRPASVHGGLTFGGGPIGNYMSHAVAGMVGALRRGGRYGLLVANGGLATSNHSIVLSSGPIDAAAFPRDHDVQAHADALRGPVPPVQEDYAGPATLETYAAPAQRDGTIAAATVVARTPGGARTLARVVEAAGIAFLTDGAREPVGTRGEVVPSAEHGQIWRPAG